MSIFAKLFGPAPALQTPVNAPGNQTPNPAAAPAVNPPPGSNVQGSPTLGTQQTQQTDANGLVPDQTNVSPLDKHAKVWETPAADPNKPQPKSMFDGFDANKMMEAAGRVDFSNVITPEMVQKLQAGGQEATQVLVEALNKTAQTVYGQSAVATTNIVKQAVAEAQESFAAKIPSLIKQASVDESLAGANALYNKPALQPLVGALRTQIVAKNPNATTQEIQSQIVEYFQAIGSEFAPKATEKTKQKTGPQEQDWSLFESSN